MDNYFIFRNDDECYYNYFDNSEIISDIISNAVDVGAIKLDRNNQIIRSKIVQDVLIGYMMEAFIVSKANSDKKVLKSLFKIATKRSNLPGDEFIKSFEPIGTGFISTKYKYPQYYNPSSNIDIMFIRHRNKSNVDPALIRGQNNHAGVQVKAIISDNSIKEDILKPLITGKYPTVITCLRYDKVTHTKDKCHEIINTLRDERKIQIDGIKYSVNKSIRGRLLDSIFCPEDICIEQNEIDLYIEFIKEWFYGTNGLKEYEFYESIRLAVELMIRKIKSFKNELAFEI